MRASYDRKYKKLGGQETGGVTKVMSHMFRRGGNDDALLCSRGHTPATMHLYTLLHFCITAYMLYRCRGPCVCVLRSGLYIYLSKVAPSART